MPITDYIINVMVKCEQEDAEKVIKALSEKHGIPKELFKIHLNETDPIDTTCTIIAKIYNELDY